ncbi:Inner membrane protein YbaL [Rubripirellula lacrimiformis]|uniref:Inner membrane protein YbaL n=1 Tax=Rubripirellula lacrimiformis TaxID=1930273 RepID=A0A517NC32_9BACT|nr:cation:proton antiporter [Rubripirellula lacrimiformis]QDT04693.1 Inner membrane protein YbaL [Rubripirellula lacrimiformis]
MELWGLLSDIIFLLSACLIGGGVMSRMGQSPLVGYLVAGMLVGGPGGFGIVGSYREIEAIAELGVALLLFSLGLEFSVHRLKSLGRKPLFGGLVQVSVTMLLGAGAAVMLGLAVEPAIAFGMMIALSSTAVVLRILMERSEIEMPHGRNSLGVLLIQDVAVVPLAVLMTVLGGEGSLSDIALDIGTLMLMALGLAGTLYVLTKIAVFTLGTLTLHRNRELTIIFAATIGLGAAWAAHRVGISPALGAFIAGMQLGSSAFATQIRADVSTLRVLLLTLFFGAAGMVADPLWILSHVHWVAGAAIALTVGKFVIIAAIFLVFRQSFRVAIATGLALAQVGEFAFVLGAIGRTSGIVSEDVYALVVSITIVSFTISAFLVPMAPTIADRLARMLGIEPGDQSETPRLAKPTDALVIGFGPTGQLAALPLIGSGLNVTVLDLNHEGVRRATDFGFVGQVGDATSVEVLEHAQVGEVKLVVITIPHYRSAIYIVELVRSMNVAATIFVRSRYQIHTESLSDAGGIVCGDEEQVGGAIRQNVEDWLVQHPSGNSTDRDEVLVDEPA